LRKHRSSQKKPGAGSAPTVRPGSTTSDRRVRAAPAPRCTRSTLIGLFFLVLCTFLAWIAVHDAWACIDGLASGADWVDVNTGSASAVPTSVAISCWSMMLLARRMTDRAERFCQLSRRGRPDWQAGAGADKLLTG
jgi:hypothetical protein